MSNLDSHLQRISERITHLSDRPSAMARDLLLAELRECYDAVLRMPTTAESAEQPIAVNPVATQEEPPVQVAETPVTVVEEAAPEPEAAPAPEPVAEAVPEVQAEPIPAPVAQEEPVPAMKPSATDIKENSHTSVKAEKTNNDAILAGKLNRKPVTDLSSGIPLNEKFSIIRNLFAGNASDFGDAVLKLNNSRSADELKHYFQLLTQRKGWDMESESYQVFLDYVDRKAGTFEQV